MKHSVEYSLAQHTELAVLSIPAAGTVTAPGDGVTRGTVHALTLLDTAWSVVLPVARYITLVAAETHTTLAQTTHRVAGSVASTLTVTGTVLAVAASRTRCHHTHTHTHTSPRTGTTLGQGPVTHCSKPASHKPMSRTYSAAGHECQLSQLAHELATRNRCH